jgi:CHAD domain-containing protein
MTELIQIILSSIDKVLMYYNQNFKEVKKKFSEKSVHDLRVTIRRFLAVLNVLNQEVSSGYVQLLRKRLKKELKLYNPLRDNQVQMLKIEKLTPLYPILSNFYNFLTAKELEILNIIKSKLEEKSVDDINEAVFFLKLQLKQIIPKSQISKTALIKRAYDEYQSVLERSSQLDKNNLDSFHKLRLAFKRFRYTMEFLEPLLNLSDTYFKQLKGFQDILGEIQDNRVSFESLNHWILKYDISRQAEYFPVIEFLMNSRKNLFLKLNRRIKLLDRFWDNKFFDT